MHVGRLLTIVNFTLLGVAIAVYLFVPSVADFFLYVLLAWMFASIVLFYLPISQRRIGSGTAPPSTTTTTSAVSMGPSGGTSLPSSRNAPFSPTPGSAPTALEFCIYCGGDLPAGAVICPMCGKPVRRI